MGAPPLAGRHGRLRPTRRKVLDTRLVEAARAAGAGGAQRRFLRSGRSCWTRSRRGDSGVCEKRNTGDRARPADHLVIGLASSGRMISPQIGNHSHQSQSAKAAGPLH